MNHTTVPGSNTSSDAAASDVDYKARQLTRAFFVAVVVILSAEIAVGVPGNLKVFILLYKKKDMRKVPQILLWNLSLVGVLVSGLYVPLFLAIIVANQFPDEPVPLVVSIARYSISVCLLCWQTLNLVAMAIDRYDSVVHPHKRRITSANVWKVVKGIWLIAGLTLAAHASLAVNDVAKAEAVFHLPNTTPSMLFTILLGNILLLGAVVVILSTFVFILRRLHSSPFPHSNGRSEVTLTRLTYAVLFSYLVSWLPLMLLVLLGRLVGLSAVRLGAVKAVFLALSNTNYVVNPFIHVNIVKAAHRLVVTRRRTEEPDTRELELEMRATAQTHVQKSKQERTVEPASTSGTAEVRFSAVR